jgi:hypothetical protein
LTFDVIGSFSSQGIADLGARITIETEDGNPDESEPATVSPQPQVVDG